MCIYKGVYVFQGWRTQCLSFWGGHGSIVLCQWVACQCPFTTIKLLLVPFLLLLLLLFLQLSSVLLLSLLEWKGLYHEMCWRRSEEIDDDGEWMVLWSSRQQTHQQVSQTTTPSALVPSHKTRHHVKGYQSIKGSLDSYIIRWEPRLHSKKEKRGEGEERKGTFVIRNDALLDLTSSFAITQSFIGIFKVRCHLFRMNLT